MYPFEPWFSKWVPGTLRGPLKHGQEVQDFPVLLQWWKYTIISVSMPINNINWNLMTILIKMASVNGKLKESKESRTKKHYYTHLKLQYQFFLVKNEQK